MFTGLCAAATDHHIEVETGRGELPDQEITGRMVSGNYFTVLGLEPAAGRLLSDADDTMEGANPVVVLGYEYWQRKFALSSAIIGKDIRLNGYPVTIVGVAPAGFSGDVVGERMSLFVPLSLQLQIVRGRRWRNAANNSWLSLIGRLRSNIPPVQAEANLNTVFQQAINPDYGAALSSDDRKAIHDLRIRVVAGGGGLSAPARRLSDSITSADGHCRPGAADCLRERCQPPACPCFKPKSRDCHPVGDRRPSAAPDTTASDRKCASRASGRPHRTPYWQFGALGCWSNFSDHNTALPLAPDWRVLAFTITVSLLTGIVFGLVPALQTLKVRVTPALKNAARTTAEVGSRFTWGKGLDRRGKSRSRFWCSLAAGLLVRSLQNLMTQDFRLLSRSPRHRAARSYRRGLQRGHHEITGTRPRCAGRERAGSARRDVFHQRIVLWD